MFTKLLRDLIPDSALSGPFDRAPVNKNERVNRPGIINKRNKEDYGHTRRGWRLYKSLVIL